MEPVYAKKHIDEVLTYGRRSENKGSAQNPHSQGVPVVHESKPMKISINVNNQGESLTL